MLAVVKSALSEKKAARDKRMTRPAAAIPMA